MNEFKPLNVGVFQMKHGGCERVIVDNSCCWMRDAIAHRANSQENRTKITMLRHDTQYVTDTRHEYAFVREWIQEKYTIRPPHLSPRCVLPSNVLKKSISPTRRGSQEQRV